MRKRRVKRNSFQKVILFILFALLIVLIFLALYDKKEEVKEDKKTTQKETKTNENKTDKKDSNNDNKDTKDTQNNSEPKKNEKSEVKQELQNNVTYSIELVGDEEITLNVGDKYNELGAKAKDSNGNDVSNKINVEGSVDTSKKGEYMVIYSIGKSMVIRTVIVK